MFCTKNAKYVDNQRSCSNKGNSVVEFFIAATLILRSIKYSHYLEDGASHDFHNFHFYTLPLRLRLLLQRDSLPND